MTRETVCGRDLEIGDVTVTSWGEVQRVDDLVDGAAVARVTDVPGRRAAYVWSVTYDEPVGWRGLPDGLEVVRVCV